MLPRTPTCKSRVPSSLDVSSTVSRPALLGYLGRWHNKSTRRNVGSHTILANLVFVIIPCTVFWVKIVSEGSGVQFAQLKSTNQARYTMMAQ